MKKVVLILAMFFLVPSLVLADNIVEAKLEKCVDGDTAYFTVKNKSYKYRFLAINTPEKKEEYGNIASEITCELLTNAKKIEIEIDDKASKTDKYGRSLGWIFVDGELLQSYLVKNGYAHVAYVYGKYKYVSELCSLEREAIDKRINIWSSKDEYDGYCNNVTFNNSNNTVWSYLIKGEYDKAYKSLDNNSNMIILILLLIVVFLLYKLKKKKS